jgi:hypothetical protein
VKPVVTAGARAALYAERLGGSSLRYLAGLVERHGSARVTAEERGTFGADKLLDLADALREHGSGPNPVLDREGVAQAQARADAGYVRTGALDADALLAKARKWRLWAAAANTLLEQHANPDEIVGAASCREAETVIGSVLLGTAQGMLEAMRPMPSSEKGGAS